MLSWKVAINVALHYLQYKFSSYDINMCSAASNVADATMGWCDLTHMGRNGVSYKNKTAMIYIDITDHN